MENKIINEYSEIFQTYREFEGDFLEKHIEKLKELDQIIPHNSTFYCITNTTKRSFEYVSKNFSFCTGLNIEQMKREGMTFWWGRMEPSEMKIWLESLNDLMAFTLEHVDIADRKRVSYTWNYKIKIENGEYKNLVQHTTPMYLDEEGKPIIGMAHYTILPDMANMPIQATAKILNEKFEYETIYQKTYGQKLLLSENITNRERDVLRLISYGNKTNEIAEKLFISEHTVTAHRKNILKKSNCNNTTELVAMCIRQGLI